MADNTVDNLQIEVEAPAGKAASELDRLTASLRKLQGAVQLPGLDRTIRQLKGLGKVPNLSGMERELSRLEKQAIKDGDALLGLQSKLESLQSFRGVGNKLTVANTDSKIRQVEQEIKTLSAAIDATDTKIRTLRKNIEEGMSGVAAPIERAAERISQAAQPNVSFDNGIKRAAESCESLAQSAQKAQKSMEGTSDSVDRLAESAQKVHKSSAGMDSVSQAAKRVERSLGDAAQGAEELGRTVEKTSARGASGLDKLADRLKRLAANFVFYRLLRGVIGSIGDSLGRMATENAKVNETLSKIVSSLRYVADALGAAIYPIIVALQPVITTILDGLAEVLNFIARIVAFFTGQDYVIQAKKTQVDFAESLDGTASSMNGVSAAAKEMARNLLGIDELNIIENPAKTGGGNGGSGLGDLRFEEIKNDFKLPETIKSPMWSPNPIPAPQFEPVVLPEWSTATLQSPAWAQNPIPSPAIDTTAVLSGLSQMEQAFATTWSGIQGRVSEGVTAVQKRLQSARQTIEAFASATQASFAAWGENVKTNFSAVMKYIPTVTVPALQESASTVVSYLSGTADGFMEWGKNVATNFQTVMGYLPGAAAEGLTAAGKSVVDWINSTSKGFASWGQNIIQTGEKAISGFVQNFVSGLAHAWDNFVGFMNGIGEKISNWWSANKSWAAPVGAVALAGVGIGAFVLSGGAAGLAASIPSMAKVAIPAMAFANGGVVRSPTLGLVGEYPGARSNPEIIAPQNILRDTFREEQGKQDYSEVINAIRDGIEAIVKAINSQDYGTHLDGRSLMQSVERAKRERGASIMPSVL